VPDPVILVGVIAPHVNPEGTVSVNVTVPANLLTAVIMIVDVPEAPELSVTGLAVIAKSRYWKRMVALWTSGPLVAVAVRV
jgi:hypothetical protein